MRCDAWAGTLLWWNCQSPVAHSCGLWIIQIVSTVECSSLMQNVMQIHCSNFKCEGHTVQTLTQWHLPPHLTSTVKLSLFMPVRSSPLSLAARLNWYWANCSHYINNGQSFSGQTFSYNASCAHHLKSNLSLCIIFWPLYYSPILLPSGDHTVVCVRIAFQGTSFK